MKKSPVAIGIAVGVIILGGIYYFTIRNSSVYTANNTSSSTMMTSDTSQTSATSPKTNSVKAVSSQTSSSHVYVEILNYTFTPKALTIKAGTIVTWTNKDSMIHTITADNGGPTSVGLSQGQSYTYKYTTPGIYGYHCSIHPTMTGMIIVK